MCADETDHKIEKKAAGCWQLRFYVLGKSLKYESALKNLMRICEEYLRDNCSVEIIDLSANPELARMDQIIAVPTVVKIHPLPVRKIIGDMSKTELVLKALDIPGKGGTVREWEERAGE